MKPHRNVKNLKAENKLYEAIALIRDADEAKLFFEDLCTPMELQAMADRWLVVEPIMQGKSYRTIHEETAVSVTTVGRVARVIMMGKGGYATILERFKKRSRS